jgi:hypothetical protein
MHESGLQAQKVGRVENLRRERRVVAATNKTVGVYFVLNDIRSFRRQAEAEARPCDAPRA